MDDGAEKIRIIIADDVEEIRNYFKMILDREPDIEVIATAQSGEEAVELSLSLKPDIVLMDIEMERMNAGIIALQEIKEKEAEIAVIILTIHETDDMLFEAYGQQASDFIVKTSSIVDVLTSIRNVYRKQIFLRPEWAEKILQQFSVMYSGQSSMIYTINLASKLTNAELEILRAIYNGETYRKIAKERFVEEVTIRTQVNKILKKFECSSMKELIKNLKKLHFFEIYNEYN